jgi:hypothetical protein
MKSTALQAQIKKDKGISDVPFKDKYVMMKNARHMIITIPSTQGTKSVDSKELNRRANRVASDMTERFKGSTRIRGRGQYIGSGAHKFDEEDVVQVEVFMSEDDWKKHKGAMGRYLHGKRKKWKQQSLAVEYDTAESMYLIK